MTGYQLNVAQIFIWFKKDSSIWAWGGNSHGQLGNKSNQNVLIQ